MEGQHKPFGFLTTKPNPVVAPKSTRVIPTTSAEVDLWLSADAPSALKLQRPLPDDALGIVSRGKKEDAPSEFALRRLIARRIWRLS